MLPKPARASRKVHRGTGVALPSGMTLGSIHSAPLIELSQVAFSQSSSLFTTTVHSCEPSGVGNGLGRGVGAVVGRDDGNGVGSTVGTAVGRGVGRLEGKGVGSAVGTAVGRAVGR